MLSRTCTSCVQGGKATLGLDEWRALLIDGRVLASGGSGGESGDLLRVGFREARLAFFWSRMCVTDEIKGRAKVSMAS